jgi:fatty acid amide hydrolase 2
MIHLSALELAARIRRREVSPSEVVEAHIARIEEVNPRLNAVVRPLFAEARSEARDKTAQLLRGGELPPFFGVPFTAKEHLSVVGQPNTGGLVRRRNVAAPRDATIVKRMRDAGFILLGTTNVPEGLTWYETYNKVYGRTSNAHAADRTSGGSSGGEGAIIGAKGSPIGLGGDMGGSIRLPAFFNGICGHKPSGGSIPETGAWPGTAGMIRRYKVLGPMARTVADLRAVMPILMGPDGEDSSVDPREWRDDEIDPNDVTVYWFDDNGIMSPSPAIRDAVRSTVESLRASGCRVVQWRPPGIENSLQIWANAIASAGGPKFNEVVGDGAAIDLIAQWLRWPLRRADHILPVLGLATIEKIIERVPMFAQRMANQHITLRDAIESKLGPRGVLVCPVFHRTAPKHGLDAIRSFPGFSYSGVLNPLELPATAVPTGFDAQGLPTGVQVAAVRGADALTLRVAGWIEKGSARARGRDSLRVETALPLH